MSKHSQPTTGLTIDRRTLVAASAGAALLNSWLNPSAAAVALAAQGDGSTVIKVMTGTEVETLDPHLTGTRNTQIATEAIHSGLVKRGEDNTIVSDLATEWSVSEDQLTWTFILRDNAMFSDGTPVTAESVKFSIERIITPENNSRYLAQLASIERVDAVDEHTVAIVTSTPFSALLGQLADPGPRIVQPEAAAGAIEDYGRAPVGSGPYMLTSWTPGQSVELAPNPHFYGEAPKNGGISLRFASEGGARTAAIESGQVDLVTNLPPESIDRVSGRDDLDVLVADSSFLIFFVLDHGSEPFSDVRVRKAANMAIDRQAIIDTILGGLGSVANSPVGVGVFNRAEFEPYAYDPDAAKQLLVEAGYPDGCPVTMWAPQGRYLKDRQVGEAVQSYLSEAGFEPELQIIEWGTYVTQIDVDPPEANMWLIGASVPDAYWNFVNNYHTDADYPNSYSNPTVDELIAQAAQTFDEAEQLAIYTDLQRMVFEEDAVHLFLHGQKQVLGHKISVTGVRPLPYEIIYLQSLGMAEE
ncbi:MAG: ABC transporter substrate-binding protein [Chloroflexota bacterium]|nr:ABC transporter substrate-binding protein [Chloroflexota bacterium]